MRAHSSLRGAAVLALAFLCAPAYAGRVIVDFYATAPGTGFLDPTPVAPVGGNPGTTLGEQRRNVFLHAAQIWTDTLQPEQDIYVAALFEPLAAGVLGSAGAQYIHANFPGAEMQNTWYFDALADHLAQQDLSPTTYDIVARFSTNFEFYLGFDNQDPPGTSDLLVVVLHEIGHGLNFANAVDETTGAIPIPSGSTEKFSDVYSEYTYDVAAKKTWGQMTDAERAASAINVRKVTWNGLNVKKAVPQVLQAGDPVAIVNKPKSPGSLTVGTAAFGAQLTTKGITGDVIVGIDAADGAGPSTTDGCSPLTNNVKGKIALLDRGTCPFTQKVLNAQNAGAIAVLIADNVVSLPPPGLGGDDPAIKIPSVRISLPDGDAIRANLKSGVNITLKLDPKVLAGTDRTKGLMLLNATNPVSLGSSISHFDPAATPNQLMEPAINVDLTSSVEPPQDLSTPLLTDLGWFTDRDGVPDGRDECLGSNLAPTVKVGSCSTKISNKVLSSGCSLNDTLDQCEVYRKKFPIVYLACVVLQSADLVAKRAITGREHAEITTCSVKSLL
jgi:hypothetical protein